MKNNLLGSAFLIAIPLVLFACGGSENTEKTNTDPAINALVLPVFSQAKVQASSVYQPSGEITNLTPSFSWPAVAGASSYRLGHEDIDNEIYWRDYIIPAAEADCSVKTLCTFTPADFIFAVGDEKAWWVQGKTVSGWQEWSNPHVFKVVGTIPPPSSIVTPLSPKGEANTLQPTFKWSPGNTNATEYEIGMENPDSSEWISFSIPVSLANCNNQQCQYKLDSFSLKNGDNKGWWIREKTNNTWGDWSYGLDFTVHIINIPTITLRDTSDRSNCKAYVEKIGVDLNGNGLLDNDEVTQSTAVFETGTPITRDTLKSMLDRGDDVSQVNTCEITDFSGRTDVSYSASGQPIFSDVPFIPSSFNQDISQWNTGAVTNMNRMFMSTKLFTHDIGAWDTSNVTNMSSMFKESTFNQNIGQWNTSAVTNMRSMFSKSTFNQDIGQWDTSSVTNMVRMFSKTDDFNQKIGQWNTSSVTNFDSMFVDNIIFNQKIGQWDTSSATSLNGMFFGAKAFNQDIGQWNTSAVTDMGAMFTNTDNFNQNIGLWDTSSVTDISDMFSFAKAFNQDIGLWNTSAVTYMIGTFSGTESFNQDIGKWDTSNVVHMSSMFSSAKKFNQDIGQWNTSSVISFTGMFTDTDAFNQDIGGWDTSSAIYMNGTFIFSKKFNQDISNWDVSKVSSHLDFATSSVLQTDFLPDFP